MPIFKGKSQRNSQDTKNIIFCVYSALANKFPHHELTLNRKNKALNKIINNIEALII
jgi:hypothetical protein|tara:strand:+ start:667 stop:837 length:171 start_codon:yes stop_codon:yes gene_type:complete